MLHFIVVLTMSSDIKPTTTKQDRQKQKRKILNKLSELKLDGDAVEKFNEIYNSLKKTIINSLSKQAKRLLLESLLQTYINDLKLCNNSKKAMIKTCQSSMIVLKDAINAKNVNQVQLAEIVNNNVVACNTNTIKCLAYEYIISKIQNKL